MKKIIFLTLLTIALLLPIVAADSYYIPANYARDTAKANIYILNPTSDDASAFITLHYEKDVSNTENTVIKSMSVLNIDLSGYDRQKLPFALSIESDTPLIIQHSQFDQANSGAFGSFASMSAKKEWYFAEGYSTGSAKTLLYIFNPNDEIIESQVTIYFEDGAKKVFTQELKKDRLTFLDIKDEVYSQKRFAIKVTSKEPVVIEAVHFNKLFSAGTGGLGGELSKEWYFPYGLASESETDFLNILNPSLETVDIKLIFHYDDKNTEKDIEVLQLKKEHVMLNNYVRLKRPYSLEVKSDNPIVAELTHYSDAKSAGWGGLGATSLSKGFVFADGTSQDHELAILNPTGNDALLRFTLFSDGETEEFEYVAPTGRSSLTFDGRTTFQRFGFSIRSSEPIAVQHIIFSENFDSAYSTMGLPLSTIPKYVEQEEKQASDKITGSATTQSNLVLLTEEEIDPDKLKQPGLYKALQLTYSLGDERVRVYKLLFEDEESAKDSLQQVLSGKLMSVLEFEPDGDRFKVVTEKNQGFVWNQGVADFIVLADDEALAHSLADQLFTPAGEGFWTTGKVVVALLAALVILGLIFRKKGKSASKKKEAKESGDEEDEWDDWEDEVDPDDHVDVSDDKDDGDDEEKKEDKR